MNKVSLGSVTPLPEDFVANHPCVEVLAERVERMPGNRAVGFDAVYLSGTWFRRRNRRVIWFEVVCYANLAPLIECGYVEEATGARELGAILERGHVDSKKERLVFAFSPTGWIEDLSIPDGTLLAEPGENGGWRTRHALRDENTRKFVEALFDVESVNEKAERCLEGLIGEVGTRFPLSACEISQAHDIPVHAVAEAFRRTAKKETGFIVCGDPEKDDWLLEIK